jgi:hypothetical protein
MHSKGFARAAWVAAGMVAVVGGLAAFQKPFRQFPGVEYEEFPLPPDWGEKTEWTFARLMYPSIPGWGWGYRYRRDWSRGATDWTIDYPRSDRHFAQILRRLTRVHARSVEQPVNLEEGDVYDWPWLYAVELGHWEPTEAQVRTLREYLLRGGFLMCDDFHGSYEWEVFAAGMARVFPDRPMLEIPSDDPIFHALFDLNARYQVPGAQYLYSLRTYEKDGVTPHWRGIYDDHGRLMVAACFNMDLGDSWEWADVPQYPAQYSELGMKVAVNYVIYAMTH